MMKLRFLAGSFKAAGVATLLLTMGCDFGGERRSTRNDRTEASRMTLSEAQAQTIFQLPLHCVEVEYPNKLGQTLGSAEDLATPKQLRPIFYGCFDWHSSVHGYWSIVMILKQYPHFDKDGNVRDFLNRHITAENGQIEKAFFEDENNLAFERTYGWAWLFKLQEELATWEDEDAQRWASSLQPLVDLIAQKLEVYLPKLVYPIRHGKHENTAFGLSLMLDYANTTENTALQQLIKTHANRLFENDVNCDFAYEPSGSDFLSPCLEEAFLMSKVLEGAAFNAWLTHFLPELSDADFKLEPAVVKDRTDGQLVHLDGLNYSRAACLYGIVDRIPELVHLAKIADEHIQFSLPHLSHEDDYMGAHWLGTFALYALSGQ